MKRLWLFILAIVVLILTACEETSINETLNDGEEQNSPQVEVMESDEIGTDENNEIETLEENVGEIFETSEAKENETSGSSQETESNQVPVEFVRVVDGDTARFIYNGEEESVRYLLVDTPETKSPNSCKEPFGEEASKRNEELLNSGQITLEFEKSKRDHYGRLLAYVFVDGVSVQETLVKEGLGRVAYIYEPPYRHLNSFQAAEREAQESKVGIWSKSGYVSSDGFTECLNEG